MQTESKAHKGPAMEGFIARWYTRSTQNEARHYRETAERISARIAPLSRVLEVAAGPGWLAIELARLGHVVSGIDISRTFVAIAKEKAEEAGVVIDFALGNASKMPYPDASFDFVVCRAAFKNFSDPVGALDEMHRVLAPGGRASIFDLRRDADVNDIDALVKDMQLSWPSAIWTKLAFRFFLLKNAHSKEALHDMVAASRFMKGSIHEQGIELELRLEK
jgi:ubiquinone/menaquinone biosynthesis C-methylase UbiE